MMSVWKRATAQGCHVLGGFGEEAEELIGFGWIEGGRHPGAVETS